ncbi:hypothetical protein ACQ4WX_06035 [Streptomyces lasalocidi]
MPVPVYEAKTKSEAEPSNSSQQLVAPRRSSTYETAGRQDLLGGPRTRTTVAVR